jgi:hypothetical protein
MRRATIMVNVLFIVFAIIDIIVVIVFAASARNSSNADIKSEYGSIKKYIAGTIIVQVITIVLSTGAIFGAIKFWSWPVVLNIIYMIIGWIVTTIYTVKAGHQDTGYRVNIPAAVITSLIIAAAFIYPQVMFVREVRVGIMTKETYINEEYSCCCV